MRQLGAASAEVCCRQFGMRSYSGMERQSAAATRVKKNNRQIHMVSGRVNPGESW